MTDANLRRLIAWRDRYYAATSRYPDISAHLWQYMGKQKQHKSKSKP